MKFALKRWWWLPVITTIALLLAMGWVGRSIEPKTSAQLLMVSSGANNDAQTVARNNASTLAQIQASNAFDVAAQQTGVPADDLRQRTRVATSGDAAVVQIEVSAPTAEEAAQQANAVAKAAVAASEARLRAELDAVTAATSKLIETPQLKSTTAEQARTDGLAARLAASQGDLLASSGRLSVLKEADPAAATRAPLTSLALLGAVGGLVLGLLPVQLFFRRRGRVSSMEELAGLYPDLDTVRPNEVPRLVDESVDSVFVVDHERSGAASSGADDAAHQVVQSLASVGVLTRAPLADFAGGPGDVTLVSTTPQDARRRQRASSLVLWPVHLRRTKIQDLDRAVADARGRSALLVVDPAGSPDVASARQRAHATA
jgi:hypothetical protein